MGQVVWSETTTYARDYGASMPSGYQVPILYGRNKEAPLKLHESANTNFLLARDNQMERHWMHPRNYPGCLPSQKRTEHRKQPSLGEVTQALLLTYLLRRLAPTLVAAFRKAPTPDFRYLERRSNHSATVAGFMEAVVKLLHERVLPKSPVIRRLNSHVEVCWRCGCKL